MTREKKTVRVVAAVIRSANEAGEPIILATQRGYGEHKGFFEFPGGKIEPGETPQEALVREIREELDAEIRVGEKITTVEYSYPTFHLSMDVFFCELASEHLILKEHESAKWLTKDNLRTVEWLPADLGLIDIIGKEMGKDKKEDKMIFVLRGHDPYEFGSYFIAEFDTFEEASAERQRLIKKGDHETIEITMVSASSNYKESTEWTDKEKYGEETIYGD